MAGRKGDAYAFFFSADGRSLQAAGSDGGLRRWELPSGKVLVAPKLESPAPGSQAIAFSARQRLARGSWVGVGRANAIRVWNLADVRRGRRSPATKAR